MTGTRLFFRSRHGQSLPLGLGLLVSGVVSLPASGQEVLHAFVGDVSQGDYNMYEFASIGDVNKDGVADFLYGTPIPPMHRVRSGKDWSTLAWYVSTFRPHFPDYHGRDVAGIGLWDDDDVPDYAIGAPCAFSTRFYQGAVRVFSGATHTLIHEFMGQTHWDNMGTGVFGLGDIDGDGHPELAATGLDKYFVRIFSSSSGAVFREHLLWIKGQYGVPVASYGDWDGDGCTDYLIGECLYQEIVPVGGRVTLFSGKTGAELLSMPGTRYHELLGLSVCVAGDWNGDGAEAAAATSAGCTSFRGSMARSCVSSMEPTTHWKTPPSGTARSRGETSTATASPTYSSGRPASACIRLTTAKAPCT